MAMTQDKAGKYSVGAGDALIIVDVQNDFLPGGSLAVPRGDEIIPVLSTYLAAFTGKHLPVFATRDWHPHNHCSFRERGGPWPRHCVAGTPGAAFAPELLLPASAGLVAKATNPDKDAYSGFEGTDLDSRLRKASVKRLFIGGLATDYCVLHTVRDALTRGYETYLLEDAVRAVNVTPGDDVKALAEMRDLGAVALTREALAA